MNASKISSLFTVCSAVAFLGGCASAPDSHLVTAPPPVAPTATAPTVIVTQPQQVVVTQPQVYAAAVVPGTVNSYIVVQAPPEPQAPQAVPVRPTAQHVWIAGYWTWQNSRYEWMAGHWDMPPYAGAVWINPRTVREGAAFRFHEGYWN